RHGPTRRPELAFPQLPAAGRVEAQHMQTVLLRATGSSDHHAVADHDRPGGTAAGQVDPPGHIAHLGDVPFHRQASLTAGRTASARAAKLGPVRGASI
ncbi:MAG: hypothetical protein ACK55I_42840, partial [bacterium]